jgi:hypothetical protein
VEEAVFSPTYVFGTFIDNQMAVAAWIYFRVLYPIPLVCFCASTMLFHDYYFEYVLKSNMVTPPALVFAQDSFVYLTSFMLSYEF